MLVARVAAVAARTEGWSKVNLATHANLIAVSVTRDSASCVTLWFKPARV